MEQRTGTRPGCKPWCDDHHDGAHPDDSECRRTLTGDFGRMYLTDGAGRPALYGYGLDLDGLTRDQAEQFFRAGLALIGAAA